MSKYLRVFIMILVLLVTVVLAQNQVAWAADTSDVTYLTASQQAAEVVLQDKGDYCDKDENKDKEQCKDKDKDKGDYCDKDENKNKEQCKDKDKDDDCDKDENKDKKRCKDKDKDRDKCKKKPCGTVKPPKPKVIIKGTGEYSVGGFCTISVASNDPLFKLDAGLKTPPSGEPPENLQKISQGCLLTYYSGSERIDTLPSDSGIATICFAAPPGRTMTLFFYNNYSPDPEWEALETTVEAGRACAPGNESGIYMASSQKP